MIKKIISGGQTGTNRAALDVAIELGIPHGGWIPKGRRTDEGRLPDKYHLKETRTIDFTLPAELNVIDSDGTLIISHANLKGDSALNHKLALKHNRPCLYMDLDAVSEYKAVEIIRSWIDARCIEVVNISGPLASRDPLIYDLTKSVLTSALYPPPEHIAAPPPKTLKEAVGWLLKNWPLKGKSMISKIKEDDLVYLHLTLGEYIRQEFGLRLGNLDLMASCQEVSGKNNLHPDDVSAIIVKEFWRRLQETHKLRVVK